MFGLIKFDAQTKTAELMQEHVERLWDCLLYTSDAADE